MKKKVGTFTFHVAHNYGAMLQAYALPAAVKKLGHDCEVIDYRFPYIYEWGRVDSLSEIMDKYGRISGVLRWIKRTLNGYYKPTAMKNKFDRFMRKALPLSAETYFSKDELKFPDHDVILFGSDQIWNSSLTNGIAEEFAGGFPCLDKTRKVAYAASCGRPSLTPEEKLSYYPLIRGFQAVGARESGFADSLRNDGIKAVCVLDPTLLLSRNEWDEMVSRNRLYVKKPEKKYLLVYVFDESEEIYRYIDNAAERKGLEVHVIAYERKPVTEKYIVHTDCGPAEFVSLFSGASCVITTSFHGTVFSLIYEKDLYCIPHPTLHERTDSLLHALKLDHRNCSDLDMLLKDDAIDWSVTNEILSDLKNESLRFLKEAIENE